MLTQAELDQIEEATKLATPGPWRLVDTREVEQDWSEWFDVKTDNDYWVCGMHLTGESVARSDGAFIAGARTWVPQLLETVRELQSLLDATECSLAQQRDCFAAAIRENEKLRHSV